MVLPSKVLRGLFFDWVPLNTLQGRGEKWEKDFSNRNPKCSRSPCLLRVCAHACANSLGMLKVRMSGCGSICLIPGGVVEWELGNSAPQRERTSRRRLPCADKSSPPTPLTLDVPAPTQSCTYAPFHHTIIVSLVPYPGSESKERNPPTTTSTQPPLSTIICSIMHPQPLHLNKTRVCVFSNSCYFEKMILICESPHRSFTVQPIFLHFQHIPIKSAYARPCG